MLCSTLSTMLCCTLSTTVVNTHCSQLTLFTFNNHCSIIVDNDQQAFIINYCQLLFQQHCNNHCSLSTSNNYWSNNTHQHCQFNKCCWTLITTLFRRCSANNVASTWSIFARVLYGIDWTEVTRNHDYLLSKSWSRPNSYTGFLPTVIIIKTIIKQFLVSFRTNRLK